MDKVNGSSPKILEKSGAVSSFGETMKKSTRRLSLSGKKVATRKGRTYPLRSSFSSSRVLRSNSKPILKSPTPASVSPVKTVKIQRKKRRKSDAEVTDEVLGIRRSVRYSLQRIRYEQSLINAYVGDGWRGQSSEKIRPELELQRAKSEIVRRKLKIRNVFQQLDLLISEGKLDENLFDAEGEIGSEDIFCAKCKSVDISEDNDIILCDGICDRGFHQKCLNPPLSTQDIPPDDEGWLCPACDCKVDCVELINDQLGTDISIEDEWEKVFPEVASLASSDGLNEEDLPSEDSEDHDYNPSENEPKTVDMDEGSDEESSSDESDFSATSSEDLPSSKHEIHNENLGLPSDDSDDQDYDPDQPDVEENSPQDLSKSDESDFTSDTDDLGDKGNKASDDEGEVSTPTPAKHPSLSIDDSELGQEIIGPVSGKRPRECLDYKKLYDETYGNMSDSREGEEWNASRSKTRKLVSDANDKNMEEEVKSGSEIKRRSGRRRASLTPVSPKKINVQKAKTSNEGKMTRRNSVASRKITVVKGSDLNGKQSVRTPRPRFSAAIHQKLRETFRGNRYPNHKEKEALGNELGLTLRQVSKWFENARGASNVKSRS